MDRYYYNYYIIDIYKLNLYIYIIFTFLFTLATYLIVFKTILAYSLKNINSIVINYVSSRKNNI